MNPNNLHARLLKASLPGLLPIFVTQLIGVQVCVQDVQTFSFTLPLVWLVSQAIGILAIAALAGHFRPKTILIASQLLTTLILTLAVQVGWNIGTVATLALVSNPIALVQGTLLSSFREKSSLGIVAIIISYLSPFFLYQFVSEYTLIFLLSTQAIQLTGLALCTLWPQSKLTAQKPQSIERSSNFLGALLMIGAFGLAVFSLFAVRPFSETDLIKPTFPSSFALLFGITMLMGIPIFLYTHSKNWPQLYSISLYYALSFVLLITSTMLGVYEPTITTLIPRFLFQALFLGFAWPEVFSALSKMLNWKHSILGCGVGYSLAFLSVPLGIILSSSVRMEGLATFVPSAVPLLLAVMLQDIVARRLNRLTLHPLRPEKAP